MRSCFESTVRIAAAGALLVALAACGGDSVRPPVVVVTPAPVRGVIAQTSFSGFQTDIWISIELILSQRGVLDITVDWTSPSTWMQVFLGRTNCTYAQLSGQTCPFILSSPTQNPKPRVLYTETLEPGTYYLVLYNVPRNPVDGHRQRQHGVGRAPARPDGERERGALDGGGPPRPPDRRLAAPAVDDRHGPRHRADRGSTLAPGRRADFSASVIPITSRRA